jgi:hypothetical protein
MTAGQSETETQTTDVNSVTCASAGNRAAVNGLPVHVRSPHFFSRG